MLPYEYSVILKALAKLNPMHFNVYLESASVSDPSLHSAVYPIHHYFNKRFYKYTEKEVCGKEMGSLLHPTDGE
jgi:hypothetical protein